jgi:hypothetical protein
VLICVSCATPFPFESLEEGMTVEAVRENFGEPEAMEAESGVTESCWSYVHEKQNWPGTLFLSWGLPLAVPLTAFVGCPWNAFYVERSMVLLDFEREKLIRWEVVGPITVEGEPPHYRTRLGATPGDLDYFIFEGDTSGTMCFPDPPTCKSVREQTGGTVDPVKVGDTTYVRANQVSLWAEPTTSGEKILLERGRRLKITDKRAQWCRVEDDSGIDGWTSCVFLTASEPR